MFPPTSSSHCPKFGTFFGLTSVPFGKWNRRCTSSFFWLCQYLQLRKKTIWHHRCGRSSCSKCCGMCVGYMWNVFIMCVYVYNIIYLCVCVFFLSLSVFIPEITWMSCLFYFSDTLLHMDSFYILSSLVLWGGNHPTKMGGLLIDGQMGYTKKTRTSWLRPPFLT